MKGQAIIMFVKYAVWIALGYCSGSVLYAYILPKLICRVDITENSEDKNPGTFNAFASAGVPIGLAALILELIKGFLPVFVAIRRLPAHGVLFALVITAPVVGHMFPLWRGFHGGKAIAVSFGVLLALLPGCRIVYILAFFYILFSLVIKIKPHALRSCAAYLITGLVSLVFIPNTAVKLGCATVTALIACRHLPEARLEYTALKVHSGQEEEHETERAWRFK